MDIEGDSDMIMIQDDEVIKKEDVDALLAEELNQMTFQERGALYEEIHGVETIVDETDDLLDRSLAALEEEIGRISTTEKEAYDMAVQQQQQHGLSREYVTSRKFRLMFLRAEQFDARKAASRLVRFHTKKLELFGLEPLSRPIGFSDLDEDSQDTLRSGVFQLLPARDRAGRPIIGQFLKLIPNCYKRTENLLKAFFYIGMAVVEDDEESQRRGVVGIFYCTSDKAIGFDRDAHSRLPRLRNSLPFRVAGLHLCSDDKFLKVFKHLSMATMGRAMRVRLRIHSGTTTECQYGLLSFGVPVEALPVTWGGVLKTTIHTKWILKRKIKDAKLLKNHGENSFAFVDLPGRDDVLLGRGNIFQDHLGTVKLRTEVNTFMNEYTSASKQAKTMITWKIVAMTKDKHCRFLKRLKNGWWEEVPDEEARSKVSMTFRTIGAIRKTQPAQGTIQNSAPRFMELNNHKRSRVEIHPRADRCAAMCFGGTS